MKNKLVIFCLLGLQSLFANVLFPSEAYDLAVKNSNKIKSSQLQVDAKKEDLNQWIAKYYPQVDLSFDYNSFKYENNELQTRSDYHNSELSFDTTLSLSQSLINHETDSKVKLERNKVKLAELRLKRQKQELLQEVLKAYMLSLNSQNKIDLLKSYLSYNQERLESSQEKYKMTISSKMDLLERNVDVSKSKIELIREEKLFKTYLLKLKQLTNMEYIELPKIDLESFEINSLLDTKDFLNDKDSYLEDNLEYQESNEMINISNLDVKTAKSAHYPKLDFDARYTNYDSNSFTTDYENSTRWSLKLKIPLYSGGYTSSKVRSSQLMQKSTIEDQEVIKKDLAIKYNETQSLFKTSIQSINVYKEALISSKAYLDFINQGYENGLKSSIDLYEAKNKVFEIEYEYIQNIQEFIQVYVDFIILKNDVEKLHKIDNIIKKG